MGLEPNDVTKYAALAVAVMMTVNGVVLVGFARHRLRLYNIYIVFSIALVAARLYAQLESGGDWGGWWQSLPYVNLAVGSAIGFIGMLHLVSIDPAVWSNVTRPGRQKEHDDEHPAPQDTGSDPVPATDAGSGPGNQPGPGPGEQPSAGPGDDPG